MHIPDFISRLTAWCHSPQAESAQELMDEAAKEIERLQSLVRFQDRVIRSGDVACLTSEEREAIEVAVAACDVEASLNVACGGRQSFAGMWSNRSSTFRNLLERMK